MSAKRLDKGEVEESVKKGPLLIFSLVLLLVFLLVTGFLLVSWYVEMIDRAETVNAGRVLLSGFAVLVLVIFTLFGLVSVLRKKQQKSSKHPVTKRKKTTRTTSPAKRMKSR